MRVTYKSTRISCSALEAMLRDQYANYVVQKIMDLAESSQRATLMQNIEPHVEKVRKYMYGKHIISRLEKWRDELNACAAMAALLREEPSNPIQVSKFGPIGPPRRHSRF